MKLRAAALVFGALFGFAISWAQFSDPDRIRQMLLLEDAYIWEMMFIAIAIGFTGLRFLRRRGFRTLIDRTPLTWETLKAEPRHYLGGAIFGVGWAVTDSCPGPIAAQLAQGVPWALATLAGLLIGVEIYLRRFEGTNANAPRRLRRPRGTSGSRRAAAGAAVSAR
jgi:uncharacterized membrane protein YedE/YeeE